MVEMVTCSRGHRFPVNMKKHRDQTYVICPHRGCGEKVKIRKRRFPFNRRWPKIKEQRKQDRLERKERSKPQRKAAGPTLPALRATIPGILALSRMMQKREEELAKKEEKEVPKWIFSVI